MRLSEAIEGYCLDLRARKRAPRTIEWYIKVTRGFIRAWGDVEVRQITTGMVREYLANRNVAPETIKGEYTALKVIFNWLVQEDLLPTNPLNKMKGPSIPEKIKPHISTSEFEALLGACGRGQLGIRNRAILTVLYDTGLRATELLSMTWERTDLKNAITVVLGKGRKERHVPLSGRAVGLLWKLQVSSHTKTGRIFLSEHTTALAYDGLRAMLRSLERSTGIHCNAHSFRHSFATRYAGDGNLFSLQKILGHTSLTMVQRYARLNNVQVSRDYKRVMD